MEDIRKLNLLEEIESISKQIQTLLIEKVQNQNNYNEKINRLYSKLDKLNLELKRILPPIDGSSD